MSDTRKCPQCGADVPADAPEGGCPQCMLAAGMGSAAPSAPGVPSVEEVERRIPGFEILSVVGHGGMGVVYKARQKALDRVVALKVLPPAAAASPGFAERFAREAKALARLQHPHIVAVHDFGQAGDAAAGPLFWLVMEYVDGMNVREAMRAGRIGPKEALAIVPQICDALQYAHDRGVVHRDVKPENVLIDRDGRVKVADFGLAKLATRDSGEASLTGAQQVMGTVHYMAPEQWQRPKEVDHRADIYSLGVVFYEMLTGELPLGRFEPPSKRAEIDVRVDEVVMRSLERERERRWQKASDVKTHVDQIASGASVAPAPVPAVAAPAAASEPEDEGMKEAARSWPDTFPNAAITFAVAVAFGIAAYVTEPALWWAAGTFGVGAVAQAITAAANRAKEPRPAAPAAPRVVTVPMFAPWVVALVGAAGVAIAASIVWAVGIPPDQGGSAFATLAILLAAAMSILLVGRWVIAWKRDDDGRRALGAPVLLVVLSAAAIGLGLFCLVRAARSGTQPESGGGTMFPVVFPSAPPNPTRADRAPWEFDVETEKGEDPAHQPTAEDRKAIATTWSRAQALSGGEWSSSVRDLYAEDDDKLLDEMPAEQRKASGEKGLLGPALMGEPLAKYRIDRVRFGSYIGEEFEQATVWVSAPGLRSMHFTMENASFDQWLFVAAPVTIE